MALVTDPMQHEAGENQAGFENFYPPREGEALTQTGFPSPSHLFFILSVSFNLNHKKCFLSHTFYITFILQYLLCLFGLPIFFPLKYEFVCFAIR